MSILAIEFNDAGVVRALGDELLPESPGYALLDGDQLQVGVPAFRRARLLPRQVHNRFWDPLCRAPLPHPSPRAQTQADLACAHLADLWDSLPDAGRSIREVFLAVPASFGREALGLLLGMARACQIPVAGLVDAAVAASPPSASARRRIHLDIQLHRTQLSRLEVGPVVRRTKSESVSQLGLESLREGWVRLIAEAFVRQTRFDPLHRAETEQELHDLLPGCLERLRGEEQLTLEMRSSEQTHAIVLKREMLVAATRPAYEEVLARLGRQLEELGETATGVEILVSRRMARLPGFLEALEGLRAGPVLPLEAGAAALGVLRHADSIRSSGEAIRFVTELPLHANASPGAVFDDVPVAPPPSPAKTAPTHVVLGGVARPLGAEPLTLGLAGQGGSQQLCLSPGNLARPCASIAAGRGCAQLEAPPDGSVRVNGSPVRGVTRLQVGDRVRIPPCDEELLLIAVEPGRGA